MAKHSLETFVGAVVLLFAASFLLVAFSSGKNSENASDTYTLNAKFDRVDGLQVGSVVKVSGIVVGKVLEQTLEPASFMAVVKFSVDEKVKLPKDSSAEIIGDGLLGSKFLALVPGGDETTLNEGDTIQFTQAAISLESLIGKFVFGSTDKDKDKKTEEKPAEDKSTGSSAVPRF